MSEKDGVTSGRSKLKLTLPSFWFRSGRDWAVTEAERE